MKRINFCNILVFALTVTVGSVAMADSKNRLGSFGGNRTSANSQPSNNGNAFRSRVGQNSSHSFSGKVISNSGVTVGNHSSSSANNSFRKPKVELRPGNTISGNVLHNGGTGNTPQNREQHDRKPDFKLTLPKNVQNQIGNSNHHPNKFPTVNLANGTKVKPAPIDIGQILKHKVPQGNGNVQPQIQNILAKAPKHLCVHPHFNWWITICHHHCHTHYGCWNVDYSYWNTWTPCNWHVVQSQQLSYYVGLTCIHIPDMQAYGVQSVIEGSPAHQGGLQSGDLIVSVNGQTVLDPNLVNLEVPRGRLDLLVIREGSPEPVSLIVIPRLVQVVSY
jgi:hypothetical protein